MNRFAIVATSALLFLVACALPVLEFRRNAAGVEVWSGFEVFLMGWLGALLGQFAWYANPFAVLAAGLLCFRLRVPAAVLAGLAILVGLSTFTLFGATVPADEGGVGKLYLQSLREGTWVWFGSLAVLLIGTFVAHLPPRMPTPRRQVVLASSDIFIE